MPDLMELKPSIQPLMKKQQIRRLPVIEDDKLVGMLSIGDIAISSYSDEEISEAFCEISMPTHEEE